MEWSDYDDDQSQHNRCIDQFFTHKVAPFFVGYLIIANKI
jgi:hypothetical protein